ncbi:MAG: 2-dehydropantoate 2-reductase [Rhodanobacter denitrificans]|uniref:2-dehydropantoate 2-reductase n=1 Tax=Rhodanobacter denitrificans TaxID=666685 RepID=A0A2W5KD89_9GAMM|nr:MAG: 2-dehydropantoate 2-reductase [Rhodanobacter denitrificans]
MKMLVLGAGGTGGYFGGRLAQAGADVTFLVRPARARDLAERGLRIRSPAAGDADLQVRCVTQDQLTGDAARGYDLVLLSCKAYDLDGSMDAIAPAVEAGAAVLPLLNGLLHYPALDRRFGAERVLGGLCFISAAKGPDGEILHLGPVASVTFGERSGDPDSARCRAIAEAFAPATFDTVHARDIAHEMWVKYSFLTALAAGTCLMRASIGVIVATDGGDAFMRTLYAECVAVAAAAGQPIPETIQTTALNALAQPRSPLTASMLRDLESGQPIEAAHIVGDLVHRAEAFGVAVPLLRVAWIHLQAHLLRQRGS